jgi:hypothetical protein
MAGDDELGDWRLWWVGRSAEALPATPQGAPAHKAGTPVYLASLARDRFGRVISFATPSPVAMALSIARGSAKRADQFRQSLTFVNQLSPVGPAKGVPTDQAPALFDFFEQCMITVTFSINALEVHCNQVIADELDDGKTYHRRTAQGESDIGAKALQRKATLEEKLTQVLPHLLLIDGPDKNALWPHFKTLKRARDSTIHMKAEEAYSSRELGDIDKESLFHEFFNTKTMQTFPLFATEIIDYLRRPGVPAPRWLNAVKS